MEPSNIVDAIIEIGNKRRQLLLRLKDAVNSKDLETVFECAEQLVGLADPTPARGSDEEKSH